MSGRTRVPLTTKARKEGVRASELRTCLQLRTAVLPEPEHVLRKKKMGPKGQTGLREILLREERAREGGRTNRNSGSEQTLGTEVGTGENSNLKGRGFLPVRELSFEMILHMCKGQLYFRKEQFL